VSSARLKLSLYTQTLTSCQRRKHTSTYEETVKINQERSHELMNFVPEDLVKLTLGGLIPADSAGRLDTSPMTGRVSAGYHGKGREGSHVKRIIAVQEEPSLHVNSTREISRVKCGRTGNVPLCEPIQGVQDCIRFKVNEFAALMRQSSCPDTRGDDPKHVWSDLKHLRAHEHGELSNTWSEP